MIEQMLRNYRSEKRELEELEEQIGDMRDRAMPGGLQISDVQVQTSGKADPMGDAVVSYADNQKKLEDRAKAIAGRLDLTEECVNHLKDPDERRVLRLYYITGGRKSMDEVSRKIPCALSTAWDKHRSAINHAEKALEHFTKSGRF